MLCQSTYDTFSKFLTRYAFRFLCYPAASQFRSIPRQDTPKSSGDAPLKPDAIEVYSSAPKNTKLSLSPAGTT